MADKKHTVRLVYLGQQSYYVSEKSKKTTLSHAFRRVLADGKTLEDRERSYHKMKAPGRPGCVYEFDCEGEDGGTLYTNTGTYIKQWHDEDAVIEWQALHDAVVTADRAKKAEKKATSRNRVFEALEPVRKAYWKATGPQRKVVLAQALEYITRYPRK